MFGFIKKMLGLDQKEAAVIEPVKVEAAPVNSQITDAVTQAPVVEAAPAKVKKPRKPRAKKSIKK